MAGTGRLKEGYLRKYGSLVSGWRKKHFTLYQDGRLTWSDGSGHAADKSKVINVRTECSMLKVGVQVGSDAPSVPTGARKDFMFSMTAKGKNYYILADTEQDLVQWLHAVYQVKGIAHPAQQQQQQQQLPGAPMGGGGMPPQGPMQYPSQAPPPNQPPVYGFNRNLTGQPPPQVAAYPQTGGYPAQQPYQQQQQPYQQPFQQQPYQQQLYQQQPRPGPVVVTRPAQQTVIIYEQSRPRGGGGFLSAFFGGGNHRHRHNNRTNHYVGEDSSYTGGYGSYDSGGGGDSGGGNDGGGDCGDDGGGD